MAPLMGLLNSGVRVYDWETAGLFATSTAGGLLVGSVVLEVWAGGGGGNAGELGSTPSVPAAAGTGGGGGSYAAGLVGAPLWASGGQVRVTDDSGSGGVPGETPGQAGASCRIGFPSPESNPRVAASGGGPDGTGGVALVFELITASGRLSRLAELSGSAGQPPPTATRGGDGGNGGLYDGVFSGRRGDGHDRARGDDGSRPGGGGAGGGTDDGLGGGGGGAPQGFRGGDGAGPVRVRATFSRRF